jgi:fumarate reductase subunit D
MTSQFPGTLTKTNGEVMLLLLAQVFPLSENDDKPHSPGVLQFILKITEVLLYVVFCLPVMFYTLFYNNTTIP